MLNRDFKEFVKSLNDNGVRYLVVGGYAVAFHGHPRYTRDLDVWVEGSRENALRLIRALADFGFGSLGLKVEDFLDPNQVVQLGYPPNRIDILASLEGVDFSGCYEKKVETALEDVTVSFIDLASLKKNKKSTGRLQDLADVESLGGEETG
jgi:hypothetical protein